MEMVVLWRVAWCGALYARDSYLLPTSYVRKPFACGESFLGWEVRAARAHVPSRLVPSRSSVAVAVCAAAVAPCDGHLHCGLVMVTISVRPASVSSDGVSVYVSDFAGLSAGSQRFVLVRWEVLKSVS